MRFRLTAVLILAAAFVFAGSTQMKAQTAVEAAKLAAEAAKTAGALPEGSRAVIVRLSNLRVLPDGVWRMHSGDLAHGEAVSLNESDWKPMEPQTDAPNDAVWFRQTYEVPADLYGYDLTGSRIWFQFHAEANGPMPEILYFNGRRVAMGDDLEPVVLFDQAKPGDKVTVAVKLLHTVDTKRFRGASLNIDFPDSRPNPEDLRVEFMSAALLVPSLAPGDAGKLDVLRSAIETVDLKALDAHNQAGFDASLKAAHAKLEALLPLMQTATWHLTGNSHIDAAWLWPWTETVDVVKRTFGTALQLMYEYGQYTYTQSAAQYNAWMAEKYPDMNAEIAQRIKEGRWEVVGGMWVEPDLNMPDGESLVRQLLVGKRWYKQAYGVDVRIGWNPDSFGYTWQLPQIYKKSGVDYFVTQKMTWNDTNKLPFKLFWWESPDGSKVLAYFPHDYANDNLSPIRLASDLATARKQATGITDIMDLYGIGDHGGGPTRAILDQGVHWSDPSVPPKVVPQMPFGDAQSYFHQVAGKIAPESPEWNYQSIAKGYSQPPTPAVAGEVAIPTWKSELYFEYHRGVMTTQANHKRNMRDAEEQVLNAEKWSSLAWLDGNAYPGNELTEDWKKVLFNQFHDLAAGSGIGVIYKDAQKDYDVVRWSTNEISSHAQETVDETVNTQGSGIPVIVYNPLGWKRTSEVTVKVQLPEPASGVKIEDASGKETGTQIASADGKTGEIVARFFARDVPALGYKVYRISAGPAPNGGQLPIGIHQTGSDITFENRELRVTVDKQSGCITSLYNKSDNFETVAAGGCGNQLQFFKDTPKDYDAWNIDPGTLDAPPTLIDHADSVEVVGSGTELPVIRITRHLQNSRFVQNVRLAPGTGQVDIENDIDWHESHVLLKAAFPLAASGPFATYEIPYGSIDRPTTRNNSWEKAQFEVPAMRWADLGGVGPDGKVHGLSVINNSKYGYDAAGNVLRLTLLRSPKWPDPDADMGHHHFHYALYPHVGTSKDALTVRHGWEYNYPLTAVVTIAHAGMLPAEHSFASVAPENVVLTAVKKAEDANGLIFRVYEWAGKTSTVEFHVPPGATAATVTNLMETPEGSPLTIAGDVVKAPIKPYEILTIRVDYPGGVKQ
ncbi:MAG: glycoside hydrolase family 38 C-terminal domain-containing protein [Terracidiphilus sp.]